jgi:hypothetical protein
MRWRELLGVLIALAPLVVAFYLFRNIEKFPTNDDWIYARTAFAVSVSITEGGRPAWTANNRQVPAAAVTPIYFAGAWSALGGFSREKLLVVTQVFVGTGVVGLYLLARSFGAGMELALLTAWTLLACPWFWSHAFTFMTDASAVGLAAASAACTVHGILAGRDRWLLAGSLVLALAVWTRQTTLALLALPCVAFVLGGKVDFGRFALCSAPPLLALGSLELGWFGPSSVERAAFVAQRPPLSTWLRDLVYNTYGMLLVVGFSLAPLTGLLLASVRWSRRTQIVAALSLAPAVFFALRGGRAVLTSATGPTLQNAHLGPVLLGDCFEPGRWGDIGGVEWPTAAWFIATLLSFASLVTVAAASQNSLSNWWSDRADRWRSLEVGLWFSGAGAGIALLLLMGFSFDRYWLAVVGPLIFWAMVKIAREGNPKGIAAWRSVWAFVSLAGLFAVDSVFTHDWLAFNETRWNLVRKLQKEGFSPSQIDGGYEVNGWHRSAEDPLTLPRPGGETALWWSEKAQRSLTIGPRPGMVEVDRATWFSWAVRRRIPIYVLCREAPAQAQASAVSPSAASSPR